MVVVVVVGVKSYQLFAFFWRVQTHGVVDSSPFWNEELLNVVVVAATSSTLAG